MSSFSKLFTKLKVGQSFVVPWFETDKMGMGRPDTGATVGLGGKIFKLDKVQNGIKVTRLDVSGVGDAQDGN